MKYAIINGTVKHISQVKRGTIAKEFGYGDGQVIACKGYHRQYFKYTNVYQKRMIIQ